MRGPILKDGLKTAKELGRSLLELISYAKDSSEALMHGISVRERDGIIREGVVLGVRFAIRDELYEANGTTYSRA